VASLVGIGVASGETLEEALIEAYYNNPQIFAERANLRATDESVPQAQPVEHPYRSNVAS
jgi:outer membrane protein